MIQKILILLALANLAFCQVSILDNVSCLQCPCMNNGRCDYNVQTQRAYCVCLQPYTGKFCEFNLLNPSNPTPLPAWCLAWNPTQSQIVAQAQNPANPCTYLQGVCQNGGQCIPGGFGSIKCICPIPFTGKFCESLAYVPCPTPLQLCSTAHGNCTINNGCVCKEGYRGSRCDLQADCTVGFCFNGGTCARTATVPFRTCTCAAGFTGKRCESVISKTTTVPARCQYKVTLTNTAGFVARFSLIKYIDGYRLQANVSSQACGINSKVNLSFNPEADNLDDVYVVLEAFTGSYWSVIHVDKDLGLETECNKCYKVWGTLFKPQWDYYLC